MTLSSHFSKGVIAALYEQHFADFLEDRMGWSFMACPEARLSTAKLGIIGLNPGSDDEPSADQTAQADWDWPDGLAYVDQPYQSDGTFGGLQVQIKLLLAALDVKSDHVFAAQLVPFRSDDWESLPEPEIAVTVCRPLWKYIAAHSSNIRLWVSLGKRPGRELARLLGAPSYQRLNIGWRRHFAELYQAPDGRVVLALPHLSRFKLLTTKDQTEVLTCLAEAKRLSGFV